MGKMGMQTPLLNLAFITQQPCFAAEAEHRDGSSATSSGSSRLLLVQKQALPVN